MICEVAASLLDSHLSALFWINIPRKSDTLGPMNTGLSNVNGPIPGDDGVLLRASGLTVTCLLMNQ